ncbi:PP2C family protein-serine/threonine phosphatase [Streptomyces sp. NPDC004270]
MRRPAHRGRRHTGPRPPGPRQQRSGLEPDLVQRRTPPPLLRTPDAHVTLLTEHDILLHQDFGPSHRTEHRLTLPPHSTLLLYTDGLVEHPGHDIDAGIAQLVALLARHGDEPLPHLVRRISRRLADPHPGDLKVSAHGHEPLTTQLYFIGRPKTGAPQVPLNPRCPSTQRWPVAQSSTRSRCAAPYAGGRPARGTSAGRPHPGDRGEHVTGARVYPVPTSCMPRAPFETRGPSLSGSALDVGVSVLRVPAHGGSRSSATPESGQPRLHRRGA